MILGITGGAGAGKSEVLTILSEEYGAYIIELDRLGRDVIEPGGAGYEDLIRAFGEEVLLFDGRPDRPKIAGIIFHDPEKREILNGIVHPAVYRETVKKMEEAKEEGRDLIVIESAILKEAGYPALCDRIWYIYASETVRRKRLRETRGYTEDRIDGIFETQKKDAAYREEADDVIDNSGTLRETRKQIRELFSKEKYSTC